MRCIDLIASFELEINKLDDALEKPVTDDSVYWINQAVMKFVKDRFNGNAPKRTSYEQNEKRTRDLIGLLCEKILVDFDANSEFVPEWIVYNPENPRFENIETENQYVQWFETYNDDGSKEFVRYNDVYEGEKNVENFRKTIVSPIQKTASHPSYDEYSCNYPKDMMYVLNEDVVIADLNDDYLMDTCVFECTADNFMYRINNSLTDFHYRYHRARPLRVRTKDGFKLLTDKKYKIHRYTLGYLKVPTEINPTDPYAEYTDFEDNIWIEIIKIAAQMYVENQSDPRYKTLSQEVLTQE